MKTASFLGVLTHLMLSLAAFGQATFTAKLNVLQALDRGAATVAASTWDIGSPREVFDDSTASLYRSASINPALITLTYVQPQAFRKFRVLCAGGTTRWRVETADTQADLDARAGTYFLLVDWTTTPNETWGDLVPPAGRTAKLVRLTANRTVGDNFVHVREWEVFADVTVTSVDVQPATWNMLTGQTKQFAARGTTTTGGEVDLTSVAAWSSTNETVATVSATGLATGAAQGQADIRATLQTLSDSGRLTITNEPTDLDVTFVERLPRQNYDATRNRPSVGDAVSFVAHVRHWGASTLAGAAWRFEIDGQVASSGTIGDFLAGTERTVTQPWTWQSGTHRVKFIIDPLNVVAESSEVNNSLEDRTDAVIAGFWVEQSLYDYFHARQRNLNVGSNSWEDWIQRQMAWHNQLCAEAVWPPLAPNGVLDRVRIDKVVIVPDGALPLAGGLATNNPDARDKTVDLMWGFPSSALNSEFYANTTSTDPNNPFFKEPSLLHELGHARYLIDNYGFDVHNTAAHGGYDQVQILENGAPIGGTSLMPFIAFDEVLNYNESGGVMSGPYGFRWSPYEAGALNLIAGRRATCGNANAPCNIGIFLQDLPSENRVRFVDPEGRGLNGADVRVYTAAPGPGWYGKTFDNTPDLFRTADGRGEIVLPRNPFNPGGQIVHGYGHTNGVLIFRVEHASGLWYRFFEVTELNMQYWLGNHDSATYTVTIDGARGCPADFNADGQVDFFDYLDFAQAFDAGDAAADFDGNGQVDFFDYLDFAASFDEGCA
jgi:hypothetical protein